LEEIVALEATAEAIDGLAGLSDPKSDGVESSAQGSHSAVASGSGTVASLLLRSSLLSFSVSSTYYSSLFTHTSDFSLFTSILFQIN